MKRVLSFVCLAGLIASCGGTDVDLGERPAFTNGVNTYTLLIYNGLTGAAINNASVTVRVGPTVLTSTNEGNVYTVTQIPTGTFPVTVSGAGYLTFVGSQVFGGAGTLDGPDSVVYTTAVAVLFADDAVEDDITVNVRLGEDGSAVTSGRVIATLTGEPGFATAHDELGLLVGSFTGRAATVIAEIANGVATLPAEDLIFGATYSIDVIAARDGQDRYLSPTADELDIQAGVAFPQLEIYMGPPAKKPVALSANNEDDDGSELDANLTVNFPYPVEQCSNTEDHDWTNSTAGGIDTDGDSVGAIPDDDTPVTITPATGSATTFTFAFNVEVEDNAGNPDVPVGFNVAADNDNDDDLEVTFTGIKLRVVGAAECVALTDIGLRVNSDVTPAPADTIDTEIHVQVDTNCTDGDGC